MFSVYMLQNHATFSPSFFWGPPEPSRWVGGWVPVSLSRGPSPPPPQGGAWSGSSQGPSGWPPASGASPLGGGLGCRRKVRLCHRMEETFFWVLSPDYILPRHPPLPWARGCKAGPGKGGGVAGRHSASPICNNLYTGLNFFNTNTTQTRTLHQIRTDGPASPRVEPPPGARDGGFGFGVPHHFPPPGDLLEALRRKS